MRVKPGVHTGSEWLASWCRLGRGMDSGEAKTQERRQGCGSLSAWAWGERARLSSANGNANGIYGPNLRSINSGRVGVNHFTIKIYVLRAED